MKCETCKKYDDCRSGSGLVWPCGAYRPAVITNADSILASGIKAMAEYGVRGYIPAGCVTLAWYGHFKGYADAKEEAIRREVDWLQQCAPDEWEAQA